jgi:hypothetical protein
MSKLTRRGFFKQTTASVATIGVLAAAPLLTVEPEVSDVATTEVSTATAALSEATLSEPVVAHVRDLAAGEISLLVGNQEIIYRDPGLVMRLLQAIR